MDLKPEWKVLLILKFIHDLSILQYHNSRGIGYSGPCKLSIHRMLLTVVGTGLRVGGQGGPQNVFTAASAMSSGFRV